MSKLAVALADTAPEPACKLCRYLAGAQADDRAALLTALEDMTVTNTRIAGAITTVGFPVSESSVRRHRRVCSAREQVRQGNP